MVSVFVIVCNSFHSVCKVSYVRFSEEITCFLSYSNKSITNYLSFAEERKICSF